MCDREVKQTYSTMSRYFALISTDVSGDRERHYLDVLRRDEALSIGWSRVNPLHKSTEELAAAIDQHYADENSWNKGNALQSLGLFASLRPGDFVFVRGDSNIVDACVVTDRPYYDDRGHYHPDYRLKVRFTPLFDLPVAVAVATLPEPLRTHFVFDGGRNKAMKGLSSDQGKDLLRVLLAQ